VVTRSARGRRLARQDGGIPTQVQTEPSPAARPRRLGIFTPPPHPQDGGAPGFHRPPPALPRPPDLEGGRFRQRGLPGLHYRGRRCFRGRGRARGPAAKEGPARLVRQDNHDAPGPEAVRQTGRLKKTQAAHEAAFAARMREFQAARTSAPVEEPSPSDPDADPSARDGN
jgi:hypothetical protein